MSLKCKKSFVTIFPDAENIHLIKDVGQIPYIMGKYYGYDSYVASYKNCSDYFNQNDYLKMSFIKKYTYNSKLDAGIYIVKNAKNIDVLNMYHFSLLKGLLWALPYKLRNKNGKIYLKLDLSMKYINDYSANKSMLWARTKTLKLFNLITSETTLVCNKMNELYKNSIKYLPNGFYWNNNLVENNNYEKENIILSVTRAGEPEKATDILIKAFVKNSSCHDWRLRIIGSIKPEFKKWYDKYIKDYSDTASRIEFMGEINNRDHLFAEYKKGKIFVLPSISESFGIVLTEAMSQGCYLIVSDGVNSAKDIVFNESIGCICKSGNVESLADCMVDCIKNIKFDSNLFENIHKYAEENYNWVNLCGKINKWLEN